MKKIFALSLVTIGTLSSCGPTLVSKEEFLKKVEEKNLNLTRQTYDTLLLSGSMKIEGLDVGSTSDSKLAVSWNSSTPIFTLVNTDAFAIAVNASGILDDICDLTPSLSNELTSPEENKDASYYIFGYKKTSEVKGAQKIPDMKTTIEMTWNDELLITYYSTKTIIDDFTTSVEIKAKWTFSV